MSDSDNSSRNERGESSGRGRHHRPVERSPRSERPRQASSTPQRARHSRPSGAAGNGGQRRAADRPSRTVAASPAGHRQLGPTPVKIVLALLAAVMLAGGGYAYSQVGRLGSDISQAGGLNLGDQSDGATDILLVGIDSRTDAKGNQLSQKDIDMLRAGEEETTSTDTIILIRVPNDGSSATAVSLPRDTYVEGGSELGNQKINAIYGQTKFYKEEELQEKAAASGDTPDERAIDNESSQAGREALISSVADVTGITVDHYAEVGLLGFVKLTDAVGGVDVCLNNAVDEPLSGAKFPAGEQTLSGPNALSFVRQRHDLPRGDLDRITRQQVYMASLANKVLSTSTLTNPSSLGELSKAIESSVVLDEGWDVMGLATQMQNLAGGNVTFQTVPVTSIDGTGDNGESVVTIDKKQVHSFFDDLLGEGSENEDDASGDSGESSGSADDMEDYDPAESTVSVYNASGVSGLASRVGDLVAGAGYGVGEVGNAAETGISESQVNVAGENDPAARGLADQLGGLDVVEDPSLGPGEIKVTLSGTYSGPGTSETGVDEPLPAVGESGGSDSSSSDNVGTPGTDATGGDVLGENESADGAGDSGDESTIGSVGTPEESEGSATSNRGAIDAGGDGPTCVN